MSTARKAPDGCLWRPSESNPKVLWLIRGAADYRGSIERKGKRWQDRDTGEWFDTKDAAQTNVEKFV